MVKDTDVIYIRPCIPLFQIEVIDPRGSILTIFDSLSTVNSDTIFGKMTLMALEKYFLEIEGKYGLPLF